MPLKKQRERMMSLATQHSEWVWGFADATGWSRVTHSVLHGRTAGKPLQPVEQNLPRDNREPKGWCCEGLLRTAPYAVQR